MSQANLQVVAQSPLPPAEIERRVIAVVSEQSDVDPATVNRETFFHEIGDSLDNVEAVMKLEEEFELSMPDAEVEELKTVGALIDYITARCARREAGEPVPAPRTPASAGANPIDRSTEW